MAGKCIKICPTTPSMAVFSHFCHIILVEVYDEMALDHFWTLTY